MVYVPDFKSKLSSITSICSRLFVIIIIVVDVFFFYNRPNAHPRAYSRQWRGKLESEIGGEISAQKLGPILISDLGG